MKAGFFAGATTFNDKVESRIMKLYDTIFTFKEC